MLTLNRTALNDIERASRLEWLEANGLGGYASGTVAGAHTRRYHGLLVAATRPPVGRMVLLSKLEETVVLDGTRLELGSNFYPGQVHPKGHEHLVSFERGLFPAFTYEAGGVGLRKTVAAIHDENTTIVFYDVLDAPAPFVLELRPFVAFRGHHELARANTNIRTGTRLEYGVLAVRPYDGVPDLYVSVPGATFVPGPDWYYRFEYPAERDRGLDFHEDLFTHGAFRKSLQRGDSLGVIVSTANPAGRNALDLLAAETRRRRLLLERSVLVHPLAQALVLAADQFIVRRGDEGRTIVAGYPWFTDWGRDAMISLSGLCLVTRRFEDARKVLEVWTRAASRGILPNNFPEDGGEPTFNSVDASLWLFVAAHRYFVATGDEAFLRERLLPALRDILSWYERGTRYGIRVDADGLLQAGEPGVQLTWMDARVGDRVVTPRHGKPVEVEALWYNALAILSELEERFGDLREARRHALLARAVVERFVEVFWCEETGCLADVVAGDRRDTTVRPNQLIALALPFPLLPAGKERSVLEVVEKKLLTPVGLRSLAPGEPGYRPVYAGEGRARDGAYHQGTVWAWLLGPYATALARIRGTAGRSRAREIFEGLASHLTEGCVGSLSEIFDAEPPHAPRGAFAQAWSVAEVLRGWVEEASVEEPHPVVQRRKSPYRIVDPDPHAKRSTRGVSS